MDHLRGQATHESAGSVEEAEGGIELRRHGLGFGMGFCMVYLAVIARGCELSFVALEDAHVNSSLFRLP